MPSDVKLIGRIVAWRRIEDDLSFEWARFTPGPEGFVLAGTLLAACDGVPLRAEYRIRCDAAWRTREVEVNGLLGTEERRLVLSSDGNGNWQMNGRAAPEFARCLDVDLEYTPATNALPINRLGLAVGTEAAVAAAWVRFPLLTVEQSQQTYTRFAHDTYIYRAGSFEAALLVDDAGLPIRYEGLWLRVAEST